MPQAKTQAQHAAHLHAGKRACYSVTSGICNGKHILVRLSARGGNTPIEQTNHVVRIATAGLCGATLASDIPPRRLGNVLWKRSSLNIFGDVHFSLKTLALHAIFNQSTALHGDRRIRSQARGE